MLHVSWSNETLQNHRPHFHRPTHNRPGRQRSTVTTSRGTSAAANTRTQSSFRKARRNDTGPSCLHRPEAISQLLDRCKDGFEMVAGSRYTVGGSISGWPLGRRVLSRAATVLTRSILKLPISDPMSSRRPPRTKAESVEVPGPGLRKSQPLKTPHTARARGARPRPTTDHRAAKCGVA